MYMQNRGRTTTLCVTKRDPKETLSKLHYMLPLMAPPINQYTCYHRALEPKLQHNSPPSPAHNHTNTSLAAEELKNPRQCLFLALLRFSYVITFQVLPLQ